MADPCWDTLLVDGVDLATWAMISSAEGLLSTGPIGGDVIERDWVPGAIWQPGPAKTYTFEVPWVMRSSQQATAMQLYRDLVAACKMGQQVTLTRRLTVGVGLTQISETCQAVCASAVTVSWDFGRRAQFGAVTTWQNLSGGWS